MEEKREAFEIPSPTDFMLQTPLYQTFVAIDYTKILDIKHFDGTLDCFCIGCKQNSTFKGETPPRRSPISAVESYHHANSSNRGHVLDTGIFITTIKCTRQGHTYYFVFNVDTKHFNQQDKEKPPIEMFTITKIGQIPSLSDLSTQSVSKYRKVLSKELSSELVRAIGLASHGVGVGSFVYLRRIFETLIEEARQEAAKDDGWDDKEFQTLHMDKKIVKLKAKLPSFLSEHSKIYSILSKGIHALTEVECLAHFDALKTGIELILDEKIVHIEREKKLLAASKAIRNIT
jgi:hypothetical protein